MTAPDVPPAPSLPAPDAPAPPLPGIRAVDGNRAALTLLLTQNVVSALLIGRGVPLGTALLGAFVATVLLGLLCFRRTLGALLRDSRWRTPPAWGLALAAFLLAFLASRAFTLAFVTLWPQGADTIPQFLSRGPDLWVLLLAAGLLVPFAEEVAFRGLMLRGHERAAGFLVAALTTSFAFGIAHGVPASVVGIVPLAYALARLTQHTGSLWNAVIVHALNNSIAVAAGAFLAGRELGQTGRAAQMLRDPTFAVPVAGGALLFGTVVLVVLHLWLTPKPDPQARSAPGPWLSAAYVVIVLFGLASAAFTLPTVQETLTHLRGALR
ncbi:CPBP family intramembrane glutamic endopeptidase [Deinococcus sp. YIM 77859]|uniref:CPBP family intramembrane glutamic endopeptidase n=1 Tax=Deinococcus sp. YIM 77859 TaxID=1540221 RepID=UPI0005551D6A|nr:type II CAAX endopeptidase family protein [Deinococcus sp. YIM 77859]